MTTATSEQLTTAEGREQLGLLARTLEREAHILLCEPGPLPSHLYDALVRDGGGHGSAALGEDVAPVGGGHVVDSATCARVADGMR